MLIVLGLILVLFYLLKKYGSKAGLKFLDQNQLKILARLSLGPRKDLFMVSFLHKTLLIGVTDQQINLVAEADQTTYGADKQQDIDTVMAASPCPSHGPTADDPGS